jgi:hypothetical protein
VTHFAGNFGSQMRIFQVESNSDINEFRLMFSSGMKESTSSIIAIDGISWNVYLHLMEFIYTDKIFHFEEEQNPVESRKPSTQRVETLKGMCAELLYKVGLVKYLTKQHANLLEIGEDESHIRNLVTNALISLPQHKFRGLSLHVAITCHEACQLAVELLQLADEYFLPKLKSNVILQNF